MFDAGRTGFDSEIWGDAEQMLQAFRRIGFSALIFKLADSDRFDAVKRQIESDPRLTLEAKRETRFYADQSEALSKFISYLGHDDLGHLLDRRDHRRDDHDVRERGESRTARDRHAARAGLLARGDPGRVPGRIAAAGTARRRDRAGSRASFMQALSISTTNFQTFAEHRVPLRADPGHRRRGAAVSRSAMGFVGGFLPAARAARLKIVDALRAA